MYTNMYTSYISIHMHHLFILLFTYSLPPSFSYIGLADNNIVLGKHSGRAAFRARLTELGYTATDDELNRAFIR